MRGVLGNGPCHHPSTALLSRALLYLVIAPDFHVSILKAPSTIGTSNKFASLVGIVKVVVAVVDDIPTTGGAVIIVVHIIVFEYMVRRSDTFLSP